MGRNLRSKRQKKKAFKYIYTEDPYRKWAVGRNAAGGCIVVTDNSTTFLPHIFLVPLIDEFDNRLGWTLEQDIWNIQ